MEKRERKTKSTVGRTTGQPKETHPSATRDASKIIRSEIKAYFAPSNCGYGKSTLANMKEAAESASIPGRHVTDWSKGANLVQVGCMAIDYSDELVMLEKVYGEETVKKWNDDRIHDTYKNLIGKEYNKMLREQESKKKQKVITKNVKKK